MTIIYGLVLILLVYTAIALSAAELVARYPTAGGQYHWTSLIAPAHVRRELVILLTPVPNSRTLNTAVELFLWLHQYYWLDSIDSQCPDNSAATDCGHNQILQIFLCIPALACFYHVPSP